MKVDRLELFKGWLKDEIKKGGPMAFHYRNCLKTIKHYEEKAEPVELDISAMRQERENSLTEFNRQYEQIMQLGPGDDRDIQLAKLMTDMEQKYRINIFSFEKWAGLPGNQEIAALYQKISGSRKF